VLLGALALGVPATAQVTPVDLSAFSGNEAVLDFEGQSSSAQLMGEFSGLGVVLDSDSAGWQVDEHSGYGGAFAAAAEAAGAGVVGLLHANDGEEILFTEPVVRVGFLFGSNVDIDVPVTFFRGAVPIGAANLVVGASQIQFFGFEDPQGIDKVVFADEVNAGFVSQLDSLRFETEATAQGKGVKSGKGLLTPPATVGTSGGRFSCRATNGGTGPVTLRLAILDEKGDFLAAQDRTVTPDGFGSVETALTSASAAACKVSLLGKGNTKTLRASLTASDSSGNVLAIVEGR
jgi:hypothetical protein